ncbi:MAG TPA: LysM domain-containing protein [Marinobacterium sp.]|nr:LysM domain-containing protein [Marinobacterium sp.]
MRYLLGSLLAVVLSFGVPAYAESHVKTEGDVIQLRDDHPKEYVVVKGDTLWDISARFLRSPWLWPEVWDMNNQIYNPHLIYPGDIIYLYWCDGQPCLGLKRDTGPKAKVTPLEDAIPTISLRDIAAFLNDNRVVDEDLLDRAPYVLGGKNQRIIAGAGDRVYARGELVSDLRQQSIYRPAREYRDPFDNELLGYELFKVGDTLVTARDADVLSLDLTNTVEEVRVRDRVLPRSEELIESIFTPRAGPILDDAVILSVLGGVANIGQFDAVTINAGLREGLEAGHVYAVFTKGEEVRDPINGETVRLPSERAGELMIFKAFDKVSYALIMRATDVMKVGDELRLP